MSKTLFKGIVVLAAAAVFGMSCLKQGEKEPLILTSAETPAPAPQRVSSTEFKEFAHDVPEHEQFDCTSCHRREGTAIKGDLPGHESCIGCHLNQFTAGKEPPAMCAICHMDTRSADPPVKAFPAKFKERFNMRFEHAAHDSGEGRPPGGCTSCHSPAGAGMTIPSGIQAHANCYTCHTPESKIGSCNVCHALGPYDRTLPSEYSNFKAIFTHGDHRGMNCTECHTVIAGVSIGRQVRNISVLQHRGGTNNCATCHNGRRAFTGNNPLDVNSCTRCHRGAGFGTLPAETVPDT